MGCYTSLPIIPSSRTTQANSEIRRIIYSHIQHHIQEIHWLIQTTQTSNLQSLFPIIGTDSTHRHIPIGMCKFYCKGKKCKYENWMLNHTSNALNGLNSNWINSHIIASQRITEKIIKEYDLKGQFAAYSAK